MRNKEFVTIVKDGVTISVDKKLLPQYQSAGWVVVGDTSKITIPTFTKYGK